MGLSVEVFLFTTKCSMILRSPTENEKWRVRHAGMDSRHPGSQGCFPETSMSAWIPALHAGMTQSRGLCLNWSKSLHQVFFKGAREGHEARRIGLANDRISTGFSLPSCS